MSTAQFDVTLAAGVAAGTKKERAQRVLFGPAGDLKEALLPGEVWSVQTAVNNNSSVVACVIVADEPSSSQGERKEQREPQSVQARTGPAGLKFLGVLNPRAVRLTCCNKPFMVSMRIVYEALMRCAWDTLKTFSQNDAKLAGTPGALAVLHTHCAFH